VFRLSILVCDVNDPAFRRLRYRAKRGVGHHTFALYAPWPLAFAGAAQRVRKDAHLDSMDLAVRPLDATRGDKISGFDVTDRALFDTVDSGILGQRHRLAAAVPFLDGERRTVELLDRPSDANRSSVLRPCRR